MIDRTDTLQAAQRQAMEQHLANVERELGSQIVVLIVPSTLPEDIAAYAQRVGDQWKIGRRDVGDGLLIVVAKNDRKVRIEVAKALEGAVPDLAAHQIITETITPGVQAQRLRGRAQRRDRSHRRAHQARGPACARCATQPPRLGRRVRLEQPGDVLLRRRADRRRGAVGHLRSQARGPAHRRRCRRAGLAARRRLADRRRRGGGGVVDGGRVRRRQWRGRGGGRRSSGVAAAVAATAPAGAVAFRPAAAATSAAAAPPATGSLALTTSTR